MIKKQGITVTMLVVTIIVLTILAGTIIVSTTSTISYSRLSSWASEMVYIQEAVDEQNNTSSNRDYTMQQIELNIMPNTPDEQFDGEDISEDNKLILKTLDLGKLKITNTVYGNLNTTTDVYAVSEKTEKVYYVQGVEIDGQMYYSLTDSLSQRFNLTSPESSLASVIFVPSVIGYSNKPINVTVKVPKNYTNIQITTSNNEIQIGTQTEKDTTYDYMVNTNNVTGNYTVTVEYNKGGQTLTTKYEMNSYDITPPTIQPLDYYSWAYKELETETIDYITNVTATDASGIRIMKYAFGTISLNDARTYFKDNGNVISNGRINLDRSTTIYTLYAEDNAGNFAVHTFEKKYIMPESWKDNVSYVHNTVPIPKGFVVSPYKDEIKKNGGIVIYELEEEETSIPETETQFESWTTRNQYVWIPVDDFSKFVRTDYINSPSQVVDKNGEYNNLGTYYWEVMVDDNNIPLKTLQQQGEKYMSETTLEEVQSMYASVKEYRGFYIARYEAGVDRVTSKSEMELLKGKNIHFKMNKIPYVNIKWTTEANAMNVDAGGAVEVSRSIYPTEGEKHYSVTSTLVYGVQWDALIQWYVSTKALKLEEITRTIGSLKYGNYSNHDIESYEELNDGARYTKIGWTQCSSISSSYTKKDAEHLLTTGALKVAKINNIYDVAGNVAEWIMEGQSTNIRVNRGGGFTSDGTFSTIGFRNTISGGQTVSNWNTRF